jgi:hypothetical protein
MRHLARPAALLLALLTCPLAARAADREVEWSAAAGLGSEYTRHAPFTFEGLDFAGPYRVCPPEIPAGVCLFSEAGDVAYALQVNYPILLGGSADVRQPLGGPFSVDLGLAAALAIRERRPLRVSTRELVRERPEEPAELQAAVVKNDTLSTDGVGGWAYLHAGLRYTHPLGSSSVGSRSTFKNLFLEAGGGWVPLVPGGDQAAIGHPLAVHGQAGVTLRRGLRGGGLSLSVRYVHALASRNEDLLVDSSPSWITFQVGWVLGR